MPEKLALSVDQFAGSGSTVEHGAGRMRIKGQSADRNLPTSPSYLRRPDAFYDHEDGVQRGSPQPRSRRREAALSVKD